MGYKSYNLATAALKKLAAAKPGAKPAGAGGPQDIFRQLMRSRLPPMTFFVEQMTEGVLKPEVCVEGSREGMGSSTCVRVVRVGEVQAVGRLTWYAARCSQS